METLGLIDELLFKLDEAGVGALVMQGALVLDTSTAEYPIDAETFAGHIASRVHDVALLRQKVVRDPLRIGHLRLVDDPDFDIHDHIHWSTVASPGDDAALAKHLEEFSLEDLDHSKPLWRFEVIDGLEDGKLAVLSKLHHSVLDGVGAVKTFASLYAAQPTAAEPWPGKEESTSAVTRLALVAASVSDTAKSLAATPRVYRKGVRTLYGLVTDRLRRKERDGESRATGPADALQANVPMTSLNVALSTDRRAVAYRVYDLGEFKAVCRALGCKINDLAMLLCSLAFEHYFHGIGETLDGDLLASMPVDTRSSADGTTGNAFSYSPVNLRSTVADPMDRLKRIQKDSQASKDLVRPGKAKTEGNGIRLADIEAILQPVVLDAAAWLAVRALGWDFTADRLVPANAVISNVPGPRGELYVAGARVIYSVPMIPISDHMALSWGISSIGSTLTIGFHSCGRALVNKDLLIDGLDEAYTRMQSLAEDA